MQDKKQQLELDVEQLTVKLGKDYVKAVYCHPAYLTYMQSSVQLSCSVMSNSLGPMDCSTPGFLVHCQFLELAQTHVN